ncbi:MAG: hypothetical protein M3N19_06645 [Candidatus Eremiobacteraeota bacterium]|nr:hypothetical protein [Candidatus Eremiobacteraeota bacterium]
MSKRYRAVWTSTLAAVVLTAAPFQAQAKGLETISAYAGTWKTHIVHFKTIYSKARSETSIVRNDCWRSAQFYACDQFLNGVSGALIVYTYDAKQNIYHTRVIAPDGAAPGGGTLLIEGNRWTYPWQDKDGSKVVYLRILNTFVDRDTIEFRQEFSYDRTHWTLTASGTEHRQH